LSRRADCCDAFQYAYGDDGDGGGGGGVCVNQTLKVTLTDRDDASCVLRRHHHRHSANDVASSTNDKSRIMQQ